MSKIKDILTKKGPHFNIVTPETKVLDALTLMKAENLSYVVVMKDDQYVGLMSERDYTHKIKLEGRKSETATVKDIMTTNYPVIAYTDDLEKMIQKEFNVKLDLSNPSQKEIANKYINQYLQDRKSVV